MRKYFSSQHSLVGLIRITRTSVSRRKFLSFHRQNTVAPISSEVAKCFDSHECQYYSMLNDALLLIFDIVQHAQAHTGTDCDEFQYVNGARTHSKTHVLTSIQMTCIVR